MSFYFGKTATVRFARIAYLDFSYIFPIETTNEPFGLKNINKPVRALGPLITVSLKVKDVAKGVISGICHVGGGGVAGQVKSMAANDNFVKKLMASSYFEN